MKATQITVARDDAHTVDASSGKDAIGGDVDDGGVNSAVEKDGASSEKSATIANYFVSAQRAVNTTYQMQDN